MVAINDIDDMCVYIYIYMLAPPQKTYHLQDFTGIYSVFNALHKTNLTALFGPYCSMCKSELTGAERTLVESLTIFLGICSVLTDPNISE